MNDGSWVTPTRSRYYLNTENKLFIYDVNYFMTNLKSVTPVCFFFTKKACGNTKYL